jgi:3-methyladenine DNA glycosylase/8-oxoguanine DNA glycosylase
VSTEPPLETVIKPDWPLDLAATLAVLWQGPGDPTMRVGPRLVERASLTPAGPATIRLEQDRSGCLRAQAWGDGAGSALESLPDLIGGSDRPDLLRPRHRLVGELVRRSPGLRLARTGQVFAALLPAVLAQKVTTSEARRSYRELVACFGRPAPGPLGLRLPPTPTLLAAQPYWAFHGAGIEQRRAQTILRGAAVAGRLEEAVRLPPADGQRMLLSLSGIGPWTAAETLRPALGDPDAVSLGDYNLPSLVSWLLAGEPRADDARMLELLEPYAGQRARVALLLERSGVRPPRYGPRLAPRSFRRM